MTATELKAKIKSGDVGGAYIFCGEEDYLKKHYLGEFVNICCPDDAFSLFNKIVFDGADVSIAEISEAIKSPPMMGDRKLIVWKYPEIDKSSESQKRAIEELGADMREYPHSTLVLFTDADGFQPGTARRPSKLSSRLGANYNIVNFEKCSDAQLISWLGRHFTSEGVAADAETLSALIFHSGHSMEVLKNEVEKLSAYAKANNLHAVTKKEVESVASSTLECDAFALSGAISDKNREKAFLALSDMAARRIEPGAVLATLSKSFAELVTVALLLEEGKDARDIESLLGWNQYKIKVAINSSRKWGRAKLSQASARLRRMDAESKSGGAGGYKMLEIFVCEFI